MHLTIDDKYQSCIGTQRCHKNFEVFNMYLNLVHEYNRVPVINLDHIDMASRIMRKKGVHPKFSLKKQDKLPQWSIIEMWCEE